jgi:hypothetical protein
MTVNARTSNYGSAGGSQINVDLAPNIGNDVRRVTLSADYTLATPEPGIPKKPVFTGAEVTAVKGAGQLIASGTTITLQAPEAAALVAAGKAVYA